MFSAWRKLTRKNEDINQRTMPSGVSSMGQSLQRKFGRGVQYNMKIVIKGDRNTGKSTLLGRFQGKSFKEAYLPTNEIQVCSINWSYRVSDNVVKVEIWDVVDKGKKRKSAGDGLKLVNDSVSDESQISGVLDAEFLDVYKGTHGCIMLMDITKQWTFKYIERELPKVPPHIPVLVLANFLDMQEHRVVQRDEVSEFIKHLDRGNDAAIVQYGECCLKNSFGLKFIHKFFNIPFLRLQRETLEKQLETNKEDMEASLEELSFHKNTEEQDYDKFIAYMEKRTNEKKSSSSAKNSETDGKSSPSTTPNALNTSSKSSSTLADKTGLSKKSAKQPNSIDDFVPDETIDSGFLDETEKAVDKTEASSVDSSEESEDEERGNPMVSGFQDISSGEEEAKENVPESQATHKRQTSFDVDIEITSDESEPEESPVISPAVEKANFVESIPAEKTVDTAKPVVLETKYDVVLSDEDTNFMDAWLNSASTDPREVSISSKKSEKAKNNSAATMNGNSLDLEMFEASHLSAKKRPKNSAPLEENGSSCDVEDEKTKRNPEKKSRESEEGRHKHRSKHKHKKKSKTRKSDGEENESSEKRTKSKRKHRHKSSESGEKVEGTGADYELF